MATKYIPSDYINNGVGEHKYDQGAANSVAFDPASSFAYVAGESNSLLINQNEFFFKGFWSCNCNVNEAVSKQKVDDVVHGIHV